MEILAERPAVCQDGKLVEYVYDAVNFKVTEEMKKVYAWDGAILVRDLFSGEEVKHIDHTLKSNPEFLNKAWEVGDGTGRASRLLLWNQPGNDVTGMVARVEKVAGTCEQLMGGEMYHYHTKLMMKEPKTGGSHLWHQDYGYWYKNGLLRPDAITAFIAMDKCFKENGGLQVVKGSHRCGRIEHTMPEGTGQTTAEQERVNQICKQFDHLTVEMNPGDCLFFHCNVLHTSGPNDTDLRRWTFLVAYNRADNDPVYDHHHPKYTKLQKVPNSALLECKNYTDLRGKDLMDTTADPTTRGKLIKTGYH